ncbi:hypothetical protein Droror1_Dr00018951 [Drosera rotundifolia]
MAVLCFVLDLENIPLQLLNHIKRCLLELANSYAATRGSGSKAVIGNRIGVYHLHRTPATQSVELKVAYSLDKGSFALRDFHQAIECLPADLYCPKTDCSGPFLFQDVTLSRVLCDDVGGGVKRKIVVISTIPLGDVESTFGKNLLGAADKSVSVEFIFFEQMAAHLNHVPDNAEKFKGAVSDFQNCSFLQLYPDRQVFKGLVKHWLQELKDDTQELLQACLIFNSSKIGCIDIFLCSMCISLEQITNGTHDKACRNYATQSYDSTGNTTKEASLCCFMNDKSPNNEALNPMKVEQTMMAEHPVMTQLERANLSIDLNIVERTNMSSLSEGYVVGAPFVVIPSTFHEMDVASGESGKLQLNNQVYQGLCRALHSLDQGLICRSSCNIDDPKKSEFHYYYILQPSDRGLMLLRRLAAAEEVLPFPLLHLSDSSTFAETENSVKQSLLEIELRDYNPLLHDGGFHQKLNLLMKESPPFGLLPARDDSVASVLCPPDQILTSKSVIDLATTTPDTIRNVPNHSFESVIDLEAVQTGILPVDLPKAEDNGVACFTGDWDNLIVDNISMITSQPSAPKSSAEKSRTASLLNCRPRDTRTSRIMERLEPPRQTKPRVQTTVSRSEILPNTHGVTDSSRLMRPIFSMVKSKKK